MLADLKTEKSSRYADFVHAGPDTVAGKFLRQFWQPIRASENLPRNRAVAVRIMGENFTLFRGESGAAQVLAEFCPHRLARLSSGWVEGDCLRCCYHGWMFDMAGACVDAPAERPNFSKRVKVRSYPTIEWIGLIFAYLGDGEPPPFPRLDAFDQEGLLGVTETYRPINYFNQLETNCDELHANFLHRTSAFTTVGLNDHYPVLTGEETDYGLAMHGKRGDEIRTSYLIMPNISLMFVYESLAGWTEHISWRVPVEDDSHISFMVDLVHLEGTAAEEYGAKRAAHAAAIAKATPAADVARAVLRGDIAFSDIGDHPDHVSIQDLVALMGQGPYTQREQNFLGQSDLHVQMLRRIWSRELRALERGEQGKAWSWPKTLSITTGVATS